MTSIALAASFSQPGTRGSRLVALSLACDVLSPKATGLFRRRTLRVCRGRAGAAYADCGRVEAANAASTGRPRIRIFQDSGGVGDPAAEGSGISERLAVCGLL